MSAIRGTQGVLEIGGTGLVEVTSFTMDTTMDALETSAMGDEMRTYTHGLGGFTVSGEFIVEAGANSGDSQIGGATKGITGFEFADGSSSPSATIILYPEGSTGAGKLKLSGSCIITGMSVTSSFDGIVTGSFTAQGSGAITFTPVA